MATDKLTSVLVENQFPQFVHENGPLFIAFIKAYYEWMEQEGNAIDVGKNLLNYQDIDLAPDDPYFDFFEREIMYNVPHELITDRRQLAKYIKDLYRSRGSEASYRLFFRMLFNEEIDVYFPGDDILRASDGRWVKEFLIEAIAVTGDPLELEGTTVEGRTSSARGRIQKINRRVDGGILLYDLTLTNVIGTFTDGEFLDSVNNDVVVQISDSIGNVTDVEVTSGGSGHAIGDRVELVSIIGSGSHAHVTAISNTSALTFSITNGGSGYRLSDITALYPAGDPTSGSVSIVTGEGSGASFIVSSISNVEGANLNIDQIRSVQNVILNTDPRFDSLGTESPPINAGLAASNVNSTLLSALTFANTEVGTIETITVLNPGTGYTNLPIVQVLDEEIAAQELSDGSGGIKGQNAVITPAHVPGSIDDVELDDTLISNYSKHYPVSLINRTRSGTFNATGIPTISGIIQFPGRYTDTKGWLSWNNRLQDNLYYQEFSYDIFSDNVVNSYQELVRRVMHPAGTKQFGRVRLHTDKDIPLFEANTEVIVT